MLSKLAIIVSSPASDGAPNWALKPRIEPLRLE
jgi:hypothetical protein